MSATEVSEQTSDGGEAAAKLTVELAERDVVDQVAVRAAGVLAEKGYWTWMFQAATEDLTSWQDLEWNYWIVDPNNGCIWEWGTV